MRNTIQLDSTGRVLKCPPSGFKACSLIQGWFRVYFRVVRVGLYTVIWGLMFMMFMPIQHLMWWYQSGTVSCFGCVTGDYQIFVHLGAVCCTCHAFLNGQALGFSTDSKLPAIQLNSLLVRFNFWYDCDIVNIVIWNSICMVIFGHFRASWWCHEQQLSLHKIWGGVWHHVAAAVAWKAKFSGPHWAPVMGLHFSTGAMEVIPTASLVGGLEHFWFFHVYIYIHTHTPDDSMWPCLCFLLSGL